MEALIVTKKLASLPEICPALSSDLVLVPGRMLTANCSADGAKLCKFKSVMNVGTLEE